MAVLPEWTAVESERLRERLPVAPQAAGKAADHPQQVEEKLKSLKAKQQPRIRLGETSKQCTGDSGGLCAFSDTRGSVGPKKA